MVRFGRTRQLSCMNHSKFVNCALRVGVGRRLVVAVRTDPSKRRSGATGPSRIEGIRGISVEIETRRCPVTSGPPACWPTRRRFPPSCSAPTRALWSSSRRNSRCRSHRATGIVLRRRACPAYSRWKGEAGHTKVCVGNDAIGIGFGVELRQATEPDARPVLLRLRSACGQQALNGLFTVYFKPTVTSITVVGLNVCRTVLTMPS